jgi:oxygen-independent coproporphyrinogen-3 oxidase
MSASPNTDSAERQERTGLGNYFVSNYPPFSFWKPENKPAALEALQQSPKPGTPLGLYLHIPFCRKRCKFCYFRVYTDKKADDIETYVQALEREVELWMRSPLAQNREVQYIYFGGGTPSFLSASQLERLFARVKRLVNWNSAAEITFECEPGTLQRHKLEMLRQAGVTRLSLGVENLTDSILQENGRAHLSEEIYRAYGWARELAFPQVNIDLISGMVGETWENWRQVVEKTIEMSPDCVTIYQMELPYNTVFSKELKMVDDAPGSVVTGSVADWPTKRAWVDHAFTRMEEAGYSISSAYTVVKNPATTQFVYRDSLWRGADMFGTGVASFGHVSGVHVQNLDTWENWMGALDRGELPISRALALTEHQRFVREAILLIKTGGWKSAEFITRHGKDPMVEFKAQIEDLCSKGFAHPVDGGLKLTRAGLLQIDRLLPPFFEPEFQQFKRYT